MSKLPANPRYIAVDALRDRAGNVSARLDSLLQRVELSPADRALARELALGVGRREGTIKRILRGFLKRPKRPVPSSVRRILHVAIYQILFLDRVPGFAAVDEAVKLTRAFKQPRYANMVNAICRAIQRSVSEPLQGQAGFDAHLVPIDPTRHVRFDKPVLPDPHSDLPGYLAAAHSLPPLLVGRWLEQLHNPRKVASIGYHANARAPLIARVDLSRTTVAQVLAELAEQDATARAHANGRSIVLDEHPDLEALACFAEGRIHPQDATPTEVGHRAAPGPGMDVLDFCAAPGTKTLQMAERMEGRGRIVAVDVSDEKLQRIVQGCRRAGVEIVETCLAPEIGRLDPHSFDVVLVDVPCSNTGVLARRPEARWRFNEAEFRKIVGDQRLLLQAAAAFVKPGGRLVYSTCSIEDEENIQAAQWADRHIPSIRLQETRLILPAGATDPTAWHDGGFWAVFSC
jgi:16S rRNA (cytosine967-C5)-methyltransferase